MATLGRLLLETKGEGSIVEVGCNQGWTSTFLLETMRDAGLKRPFIGIDTFEGFLSKDVQAEYGRGKKQGSFNGYFVTCNVEWYRHSLKRSGYDNVQAIKEDCGTVDFSRLAPIAFALIDVDVYRPSLLALRHIWPHMADGGIIVCDDCDRTHELWDGAHQAYREFCEEIDAEPEIVHGKFGILRKPTAPASVVNEAVSSSVKAGNYSS